MEDKIPFILITVNSMAGDHLAIQGTKGEGYLSSVNFSIKDFFDFAKVHFIFFKLIHIWQMSLQLRCGDICQLWTRYSIDNRYTDKSGKLGK